MATATTEKAAETTWWQELRKPFPAEQIGKLPKITCSACSKAQGRVCDRHSKSDCKTCGNWITGAHMHLDYVGHAATRDRLFHVDPEWSWEPMATDERGLPLFDSDGGLWMWLIVKGVRKPGYGEAEDSLQKGAQRKKIIIGDAIRNAAINFGVAIDLWSKEDLLAASEWASDRQAEAPAPAARQERPARDWLAEAKTIVALEQPASERRQLLLSMLEECERFKQMTPALRRELIKFGKALAAEQAKAATG